MKYKRGSGIREWHLKTDLKDKQGGVGGDPEVGKSFDTLQYMAEKAIESNRASKASKQKYNEVSKAEVASLVAQW